MHDVYIIPGVTQEEQFRKEAYRRIQEGDGFTTFHHHPYERRVGVTSELKELRCNSACYRNDPYPGHLYVKSDPGLRAMNPETCAVYQHLDPLFYTEGSSPAQGHCIDCHCDCEEFEPGDERSQMACSEHASCPGQGCQIR